MNIIEKIKAEIKSRIKFHDNAIKNHAGLIAMSLPHAGGLKEDEYLLSFLSTLEPEKPAHAIEEPIDGVLYAAACGIKNAAGKTEKPMNQEGLDEEIIKCWQEWVSPSNEQSVDGVLPLSEFAFFARHFAQWGAENLKK